jgi:glyoxylase-like metal-dependent hydrolase (beta-lactamase superfamily II)
MVDVSRREMVIGAAAASAAFGLDGRLVIVPSAVAQEGTAVKPFHTFKVGSIEVTTVYDGFNARPLDAAFVKNAPLERTEAALVAAGLPKDPLRIPFTVTIVRSGGRTIMFDSGTGAQLAQTAGLFTANLAAAGIDATRIDTLVVTHFHPDHIFGLMAKDTNAQVFPNAQIVVPKAELAFWNDSGVFARLPQAFHGLAKRIQATLPTWKNVTPVDGEAEVVPGVRAIPAYGHTPGHTVYAVGSGSAQLLVLADTANVPALFVRNPGWHIMFDADGPAAEAVRRRLFDRAIADKAIVTGYHFGMPGAGRMEKDGDGYAFVPVA